MREEPTDLIALKLWWAMTWRTLPLALGAGMIVGMVIGAIVGVTGGRPEEVQGPAAFAGAVVGVFVTVKVLKWLMVKGFGQYKLVVISNDAG